jgi:ABC-type Zn uptake system ZnuABC Zn-binding protein ZnuA
MIHATRLKRARLTGSTTQLASKTAEAQKWIQGIDHLSPFWKKIIESELHYNLACVYALCEGPDTLAAATIAALSAVGALLATALLVVPAATARLVCTRIGSWRAATAALAAVQGVAGLWLSVQLNAPPGPAIAVLGGALFAGVAAGRAVGARRGALLGAVAVGAAAPLVVAGCGGDTAGERTAVVATSPPVADLVRNVAGARVEVHGLLRPSTDPHDYEPRPRDVQDTAAAPVAFINGDRLDDWMADVLRQSGSDAAVVDLGARAPVRRAGDPHWWHDPRNALAAIGAIRAALTRADPAGTAVYRRNARRYARRVRALDAGIARCMAAIPAGRRRLVTDHDAFGYFAARYGIAVVGAVIPAATTLAQPSAGDLAELTATIRREGVRAVFPERALSARLAEAVARQTGATTRYELFGDTLGAPGSPGATYLGMERANADAMVRGFTGGRRGCTLPAP